MKIGMRFFLVTIAMVAERKQVTTKWTTTRFDKRCKELNKER